MTVLQLGCVEIWLTGILTDWCFLYCFIVLYVTYWKHLHSVFWSSLYENYHGYSCWNALVHTCKCYNDSPVWNCWKKQKTMDLMILCSLPAFADWEIREFYKDSLYCQLQIRFPWNKRKCFPNQELIISLDNQILKNGSGIDIFSPISILHMIKLNLKLQGREKKI